MKQLNNIDKQLGSSTVLTMIFTVMLVLTGLMALKVIPSYIQNHSIRSVLEEMSADPQMKGSDRFKLKKAFMLGLKKNAIYDFDKENVEINKEGPFYVIRVSYQVKKSYISNIDLVMSFEESAEIPVN